MSSWDIQLGDWIEVLRSMPDNSVHCVVTSPPYWGVRDYDTEGQLGLEPNPQVFVEKIVAGFRELRRVLRDDGTLWMNFGDSYATGTSAPRPPGRRGIHPDTQKAQDAVPRNGRPFGLKPKDIVGMPWRIAFALQADGWYLRQDIVWHKPNPMPESATDRCTKSHEYIFLLSKSERYFYDAFAVRERASLNTHARGHGLNPKAAAVELTSSRAGQPKQNPSFSAAVNEITEYRNKRSVWSVATFAFGEAHFATFPPELIEPCILAGTSEAGCCSKCGAPWTRIVEKSGGSTGEDWNTHDRGDNDTKIGATVTTAAKGGNGYAVKSVGWDRGCTCAAEIVPCTVYDPFSGAGTVALVSTRLGRNFKGSELNPEYRDMSIRRIESDAPLFNLQPQQAPQGREEQACLDICQT
jgi:DNA modification methylase